MNRGSLIALALAATAGMGGCASSESNHVNAPATIAQATKPTAAAPATQPVNPGVAVDPAKRLADAKIEFQVQHFRRAVELLAGLNDPVARTITAMADLDLAKEAADPAPLTSAARGIASDLSRRQDAAPRGELLSLYIDNPVLRTTTLRDLLSKTDAAPADLFYTLGTAHYNAGTYALALATFRRGETLTPGEPRLVEGIVRTALAAKDWDVARVFIDKASQANLDKVHGLNYLILLERARGDHTLAVADYVAFTKAHPDVANGWFAAAEEQTYARDFTAARASLSAGLALDSESLMAQRTILYVELAATPVQNPGRARAALDKAMKLAPNDAALEQVADRLQSRAEVIQRRMARLAAAPEDEANRLQLASALALDKQFPLALDVYKPVSDAHPDDYARVSPYVLLLVAAAKYDDAIQLAEKYTAKGPDKARVQALLDHGTARLGKGDRNALLDFEAAAALDGDGGLAARHLADAYFDAGLFDPAASRYEKILGAPNGDAQRDPALRAKIRRRLAECWLRSRDFRRADALVDEILAADPKDFQALQIKGMSQASQGHEEEARAAMNAAVQIDPENPTSLYFRALVMDPKDIPLAIQDMEHVAAAHPEHFDARMLLLRLYLANRQAPEAELAYQKLLKDFAADPRRTGAVQAEYTRLKAAFSGAK